MQTDSRHIIHKLTLEVNTSSTQQGYEIKDNMRSFIDTHVVPAIEHYFARLTTSMSADDIIQLDKLELTVSNGKSGWDVTGLAQAIHIEFDKAVSVTLADLTADSVKTNVHSGDRNLNFDKVSNSISEVPKVENAKVFTKTNYGVLAWISFLNDGTTDWFTSELLKSGSHDQEVHLLNTIFLEVETLTNKRHSIFGAAESRKRLIAQFSDDFLISLVAAASRKPLSFSYSSVLPYQKQPIEAFIRELLRGTDFQTRILFWEVVFGMLKLDTNRAVLPDEAFLLEMERFFPKATQLLKTEQVAQKKKDSSKSAAKTIAEDSSTNSIAESSLMFADVPMIGIRLLEWLEALQSKPVSLKKYIALQTSVAESKRSSADTSISTDANTRQNTSPTGLVKPRQKDVAPLPETNVSATKQQPDAKNSIDSTIEKTENQTNDPERDLKEQQLNSNNGPERDLKKQQLNSSDESEQAAVAKEQQKSSDLSDSEEVESVFIEEDHIQDGDFQSSKDTVLQPETTVDPFSELEETTASPANPVTLPGTNNPVKSTDSKEKEPQPPKKKWFKDEQAHLLVENAGLVILNPFLKHFFKGIGLLNEENALTDKVLAAHVLHYVATGRERDFEQLMTFEKYLVGIDPFESIPREIAISDAIKAESENLLKAVRDNWKPLQSSSSASLRETFIQRHGKLIHESTNPRLVIERKTVDVLMNQLNWTISIIRLPWLDEIIFVEW
jgi:Contractile injection system tape measure protein